MYPRHVAKAEAVKAFGRLVKPGPAGLALCKLIRAGLVRYKAQAEARGPEAVEYLAYPATWLNGRRWEDEGPVTASSGGSSQEVVKRDSSGGIMRRG